MKKTIISLIMVFVMAFSAFAGLAEGIDIENMTLEQLQQLQQQLDKAITDKTDGTDAIDGTDKLDEPEKPAEPEPTAEPVPIKGISLSTQKVTLNALDTLDVAEMITLTPANASKEGLTYTFSNLKPAYINTDDGLLHAVLPGTTTVTVTDPESRKSARFTLTVNQPVLSVMIEPENVSVAKGKSVKLTADLSPKDTTTKKLTWTTSDDRVARISSNGTVTGVSAGSVKITCTAEDDIHRSATTWVTVTVPVRRITLPSKSATIMEERTMNLGSNVEPADATDKSLDWSSSNPYIASVDSYGTVTGNSVGEVTITAVAKDGSGVKASEKVYVEPTLPLKIDYLRWKTQYYAKTGQFAVDAISQCVNRPIRGFSVRLECYDYPNSTPYVSSHYFCKRTIQPGKRVTSEWSYFTAPGLTTASIVKATVFDVYFADGTYYEIPSYLQETITFNLNSY